MSSSGTSKLALVVPSAKASSASSAPCRSRSNTSTSSGRNAPAALTRRTPAPSACRTSLRTSTDTLATVRNCGSRGVANSSTSRGAQAARQRRWRGYEHRRPVRAAQTAASRQLDLEAHLGLPRGACRPATHAQASAVTLGHVAEREVARARPLGEHGALQRERDVGRTALGEVVAGLSAPVRDLQQHPGRMAESGIVRVPPIPELDGVRAGAEQFRRVARPVHHAHLQLGGRAAR